MIHRLRWWAWLLRHRWRCRPEELADREPCHRCGIPTPVLLLDAKPPPGEDPETADFTVLQCGPCYGPGWCPP